MQDLELVIVGSGATAVEVARRLGAAGRAVAVLPAGGVDGTSGLRDVLPDVELSPLPGPGHVPTGTMVLEEGGLTGDARHALLADLSAALDDDVVLAPVVESVGVGKLAAASARPGRVVGVHLSFAAPTPQLFEVIAGLDTEPEAAERCTAALRELDFDVIPAPDGPGFLVDAVLRPYLNQVIQALDDGIASAEDIDTAVELGLGYPIGPLSVLDRLGLDHHLAVTTAMHDETQDPHDAPPPLLRRMVTAGRNGERAGRGFRAGIPDTPNEET
jgi:3-hydroxybutyryl-CoA dehydrogenase